MACLLGVQQSFARAELALAEVAGWRLDDNTIRRLCHATAVAANDRRKERTTARAFAEADGDIELQIDTGKVNTLDGWRDVKVAVFDRRERGEPTTAENWDERQPAHANGAFSGSCSGGRGTPLVNAVLRKRSDWS